MSTLRPITILHLSDMQFGRYHRFGRLGAFVPDATFDTLLQRLTDDLQGLKKDHNLEPQRLVASGDLAEWGLPKEFADAREFLEGLIDFRAYLKRQKQKVESDPVYPPSLYVPQRVSYSGAGSTALSTETQSEDALKTVTGQAAGVFSVCFSPDEAPVACPSTPRLGQASEVKLPSVLRQ